MKVHVTDRKSSRFGETYSVICTHETKAVSSKGVQVKLYMVQTPTGVAAFYSNEVLPQE